MLSKLQMWTVVHATSAKSFPTILPCAPTFFLRAYNLPVYALHPKYQDSCHLALDLDLDPPPTDLFDALLAELQSLALAGSESAERDRNGTLGRG